MFFINRVQATVLLRYYLVKVVIYTSNVPTFPGNLIQTI